MNVVPHLLANIKLLSYSAYSTLANLRQGVLGTQPENVPTELLGQGGVFQAIANIMLIVIGAVAVIMLIVGGFRYVVSGGDSNSVEAAKNTILYAIIGIVVAFLAYAAVNFLTQQLTQSV